MKHLFYFVNDLLFSIVLSLISKIMTGVKKEVNISVGHVTTDCVSVGFFFFFNKTISNTCFFAEIF